MSRYRVLNQIDFEPFVVEGKNKGEKLTNDFKHFEVGDEFDYPNDVLSEKGQKFALEWFLSKGCIEKV